MWRRWFRKESKNNKKKWLSRKLRPPKNLDPLGVSVENSDPVISLIRDNKWYTTEAITDYVNDVLFSFWPLLRFVTEQTHGNMESTSFRSKRDKSYQILFISVESDSRGCFAPFNELSLHLVGLSVSELWVFNTLLGSEFFGAVSFRDTQKKSGQNS